MIGMLDFLLADLNPRSLPFAQTKSLYVCDEATHILRPFKDHANDHRYVIGSPLGRTFVRIGLLRSHLNLRTAAIEFESVAAALAAYQSLAYQTARKVLGDGAVRDIRIVEGLE